MALQADTVTFDDAMDDQPDVLHMRSIGKTAIHREAAADELSLTFPEPSRIEPGTGRIMCVGGDHPIKAEDLGGVGTAEGGGEAWFCNSLPCMLKAADHMTTNHANELRSIAKGKEPKPPKEEYRGHSKAIPF